MTGWSEIRKMLGNVSKSATNISLLLCLPAPHTHTHTHTISHKLRVKGEAVFREQTGGCQGGWVGEG